MDRSYLYSCIESICIVFLGSFGWSWSYSITLVCFNHWHNAIAVCCSYRKLVNQKTTMGIYEGCDYCCNNYRFVERWLLDSLFQQSLSDSYFLAQSALEAQQYERLPCKLD